MSGPRASLIVVALAVVLVALRGVVAFTSIEAIAYDEALYRGTIARELTTGLKAPLWEYQADPYQGGSLVVGLLAAPLFALLGPRFVVLTIVPLLFALGTLIALLVFLRQNFGEDAAVVGGVLYVLAPPGPTRLSLLPLGFHTDCAVLIVLTLVCWYRFLHGPSRRRLSLALFGLCAGLGFSFTYVTAVVPAACLLSWPLMGRSRPSARDLGCLGLGLGLGLTPWLAYNLTHDFSGLRFLVGVFVPPEADWRSLPVRWLRKIGALLVAIPRGYGFAPLAGVEGAVLSYVYGGLVAFAAGAVVVRARDTRLLPIALAVAILVVAYTVSRYDTPVRGAPFTEFRYFYPLHLLLLMLAAIGVSQRRAVAVAGALILLGGIGQAEAMLHHRAPRAIDYRGYAYVELGKHWYAPSYAGWSEPRYAGSVTFAEALPFLRQFAPPERRAIFRGLTAFDDSRWADPAESIRRLGEADAEFRVYLAEAIGRSTGVRNGHDAAAIDALAAALTGDERDHFEFGYAGGALVGAGEGTRAAEWARREAVRGGPWVSWSLGELLGQRCDERDRPGCAGVAAVVATLGEANRAQAYRGLGRVLGGNWTATLSLDPDRTGEIPIPPAHRGDVAWGIGWGLRETYSEDRIRVLDWVARLPPDRRAAALDGVRAADAWYRLEGEP